MGLRCRENRICGGDTHKYVTEEGSRASSCGRAPHGVRGLKLLDWQESEAHRWSRPAWDE